MLLVMIVGLGWGHPLNTNMITIIMSLIVLIIFPISKKLISKLLYIKIFIYILLVINLFPSRFFTGEKVEDFMGIDVPFLSITFCLLSIEFFAKKKKT
jgi:hypothetical protein